MWIHKLNSEWNRLSMNYVCFLFSYACTENLLQKNAHSQIKHEADTKVERMGNKVYVTLYNLKLTQC